MQADIDPDQLKVDLEKRLAMVNQKLVALPAEDASIKPVDELSDKQAGNLRRNYLKQLIYMYQGQIARLANLKTRRESRIALEKQVADWLGFKQQPNYPFLLADDIQDSISNFNKTRDQLESLIAVTEQAGLYLMNALEASTIKLRQADEALEQAKDGTEKQANLRRKREQLELENQNDMARLVSLQIEKNLKNESLLETQAMLQLAYKQLGELSAKQGLTEQELNQSSVNIEIEKQRIQTEIKLAINAREAMQKVPATTLEIESSTAQQNHLTRLNNIDIKLQVLNRMLSYLDLQREIWQQRWNYSKVTDRKQANAAYALISKNQEVLETIYQYISLHRQQALMELTDQTNKNMAQNTPETEVLNKTLDGLDFDQIIMYSRLLHVVDATENLLLRAKAELDEKFVVTSLSDWFSKTWLATSNFFADTWALELFAVEDNIVVNGQMLTTQRSVTVSKVVTALAILVIGYWLAARLARWIETFVVNKFDIDTSLARIARRWIFFLEFFLLIIISMLVVRIPLTVFAFMGGAVAIGAGFGMQNLLKNLISGLMLLMERPFRPGDLVEVAGVRGRITDIGVRSTQILDANGIETLIPNSTFIEQNVTNWTFSDQVVRITVNVGVAYGSSTKEVKRLLLDVAGRHGLVLDVPEPQVLFEDFGNDALMFGLYIWVQLKPDVSWKVIASDLRFIINKSFEEHGIIIAFPQRDIHLDASRPLDIRLVADTAKQQKPVATELGADKEGKLPG